MEQDKNVQLFIACLIAITMMFFVAVDRVFAQSFSNAFTGVTPPAAPPLGPPCFGAEAGDLLFGGSSDATADVLITAPNGKAWAVPGAIRPGSSPNYQAFDGDGGPSFPSNADSVG
jgi:hypothetical protein